MTGDGTLLDWILGTSLAALLVGLATFVHVIRTRTRCRCDRDV